MATVVTISEGGTQDLATQKVYTRARWGDDWTFRKHLWCDAAEWSTAPRIGSASLAWRYGSRLAPGESTFQDIARLALDRFYVKVEITRPGGGTLLWHGTIEIDGDRIAGTRFEDGGSTPYGEQSFTAEALEATLGRHTVRTSRWQPVDGNTVLAERGIIFNADGFPNRTPLRFQGGAYLFGPALPLENTNQFWSSRDIVEHLIVFQRPTDDFGNPSLPIVIANADLSHILNWDVPTIDPTGMSTRELLNSIITRQRLLAWWLDVDDATNEILVRITTLTNKDLNRGDGKGVRANSSQKLIDVDQARTAQPRVKTSSVDVYDKVRARGRRRRSVFTISFADGTLAAGWSAFLQTEYNEGASTAGDYPAAAEIADRQKRNSDARRADRLSTVYSRFVLPAAWNYFAKDGEGGAANPVTPDDDFPAVVFPLYPPDVKVQRTIPLLAGRDYSGSKITNKAQSAFASGSFPDERPILALLPIPPATGRFQRLEVFGTAADLELTEGDNERRWSGRARAQGNDASFDVRISDKAQHVIAKTDFSPADSSDDTLGDNDWRDMIVTLAIEDDRFCEGSWPPDVDASHDDVRVLELDIGDWYKLDYAAPGTVVDVNPNNGFLVRTTEGGFINDDRILLEDIAWLAHRWYSQARASLTLDTSDFSAVLGLGDLITQIGRTSVQGAHQITTNSVITSMAATFPRTLGTGTPAAPRIVYQTQFSNLDPVQV